MRNVVTNYTGDRGNWGCQATSRELLRFLQETVPDRDANTITTVPLPTPHAFDRHVESGSGERLRWIYSERKACRERKRCTNLPFSARDRRVVVMPS